MRSAIQSERYSATLIDEASPLLEQNMGFTPSRQHLDLTGPLTLQFQLVNKSLAQMHMIDVGQVFRGCTVDEIIRTLFTQASLAATVDCERPCWGVTMVPSANQQPREPIMNPQRVRLVEHFQ